MAARAPEERIVLQQPMSLQLDAAFPQGHVSNSNAVARVVRCIRECGLSPTNTVVHTSAISWDWPYTAASLKSVSNEVEVLRRTREFSGLEFIVVHNEGDPLASIYIAQAAEPYRWPWWLKLSLVALLVTLALAHLVAWDQFTFL